MSTKRIEWLDAMRGFTMILVVFSHIKTFGFGDIGGGCHINSFFMFFRMPLFFFVSGFIAYKVHQQWTLSVYKQNVLKKLRVQLIPMLFFGLLYTAIVFSPREDVPVRESIVQFFNSPDKFGYWFTEVLLLMFLIYYTVSLLLRKCKESFRFIVLACLAIVMFACSLLGQSFYQQYPIANYLCISNLLRYFQFFVFGLIFSCYQKKLFRFLGNQYVAGAILVLFFGTYWFHMHYMRDLSGSAALVGDKLLQLSTRYLGVISVLTIFYHYQGFFSSYTFVGRGLQYIGKRTLDVYLLHYFFLPHIPQVGAYFAQNSNLVLETTTTFVLALLVICFCLIVSNIIRISPFLSYYLLGVKRENKR